MNPEPPVSSVILRFHLSFHSLSGGGASSKVMLFSSDQITPPKMIIIIIIIKVLVLSLPQGLFSPSAWFLECVFFVCSAVPWWVLISPFPPVVFWVSSSSSSSSSSCGWLQNKGTDPKMCTLNTGTLNERGCKTQKRKKEKRRKHILKAKDTSMHSFRLSHRHLTASRGGGGIASSSVNRGHLCLYA